MHHRLIALRLLSASAHACHVSIRMDTHGRQCSPVVGRQYPRNALPFYRLASVDEVQTSTAEDPAQPRTFPRIAANIEREIDFRIARDSGAVRARIPGSSVKPRKYR